MRNPGTDYHRREDDARRTNELIAGQNRARENAREWIRRADAAYAGGEFIHSSRLIEQAKLELKNTPWSIEDVQGSPRSVTCAGA